MNAGNYTENPAERKKINTYRRENPRNVNHAKKERIPNNLKNAPTNEKVEPESPRGSNITRDARDFQVNQIKEMKPTQTNLNLVQLPIRETKEGRIPLLVDTGSSISLVKIRVLQGDTQMIEDKITSTGITGHQAQTIGRFNATINLGDIVLRYEFYAVTDNFPIEYDGILGSDFMKKYHATCCYLNNKLYLPGKTLMLLPYRTYQIPARSEMIIRATTNTNSVGVIRAEERKPGVFIGNCLVQPTTLVPLAS